MTHSLKYYQMRFHRRRLEGFTLSAIAREYGVDESDVYDVLGGREPQGFDTSDNRVFMRKIATEMLYRPKQRLLAKVFAGCMESYRKCVWGNFADVITREEAGL